MSENNKINTDRPSGFELVAMVLRISPAPGTWAKAKALLLHLADYCGEGNYTTRVGGQTLAQRLDIDVKSVSRHLALLREHGLITTQKRGANVTDLHTLNLPLLSRLYLDGKDGPDNLSIPDRTICPYGSDNLTIRTGQNVLRSDQLTDQSEQTRSNRPVKHGSSQANDRTMANGNDLTTGSWSGDNTPNNLTAIISDQSDASVIDKLVDEVGNTLEMGTGIESLGMATRQALLRKVAEGHNSITTGQLGDQVVRLAIGIERRAGRDI